MPTIVHLDDSLGLSPLQLAEITAFCHSHFDDLTLTPSRPAYGLEIGTISDIVAAVAAVIGLCIQLSTMVEDDPWTLARLKDEIHDEFAAMGLLNIHIVQIVEFDSLRMAKKTPCKVTIESDGGVKWNMYVYRDGSKYTVRSHG